MPSIVRPVATTESFVELVVIVPLEAVSVLTVVKVFPLAGVTRLGVLGVVLDEHPTQSESTAAARSGLKNEDFIGIKI